jgi:4-diphosphocytidyl-2-C-methyl-D-erythritol kinase
MRLGADVPVMLAATRALMTGAGEEVEPIAGDKPPLIVVPLDAHLNTGEVYARVDALGQARSERELEDAAARIRAGHIDYVNDLEPAARRLCPLIDPALEALREAGCEHAMVSGSGPTVFGIGGDLERVRSAYPQAVAT